MLLIDDPKKICVESITAAKESMEVLYDFDLMMKGGRLKGWKLNEEQIDGLAAALERLSSDEAMQHKYGLGGVGSPPCCSPWATATTAWLPPRPAMRI